MTVPWPRVAMRTGVALLVSMLLEQAARSQCGSSPYAHCLHATRRIRLVRELTASRAPGKTSSAPGHEPSLPELTLPCMDGSGHSFSFRTSLVKPLVVNLWGSWCPPCGQELPAFQRLYEAAGRGKDASLRVLGVVTEDSASKAGRLLMTSA